ncbi:MAG: Tm-1-like ATP-binding domain-containing protein, partial [Myxococcota bacterium]|nr:Tm-1-like ATP-binding domain-containing protein [Myxococcota bacterium]
MPLTARAGAAEAAEEVEEAEAAAAVGAGGAGARCAGAAAGPALAMTAGFATAGPADADGATPPGILIVGMPMIVAERGGCLPAAAAAAIATASADVRSAPAGRPLLGATMFGVTTPCVTAARERLEALGYEVLVFHATGTGGKTLEQLVREGA